MPSFDIVCKTDEQEIKNALSQAQKEIVSRYDFKGTKSEVTQDEAGLVLVSSDDSRLEALEKIVREKLAKRGISARAYQVGDPEPASEGRRRCRITFQKGIEGDDARAIVKIIKQAKLKKIQAQIQGDQVRVTGPKIDNLQEVIQLLRNEDLDIQMNFVNTKR